MFLNYLQKNIHVKISEISTFSPVDSLPYTCAITVVEISLQTYEVCNEFNLLVNWNKNLDLSEILERIKIMLHENG